MTQTDYLIEKKIDISHVMASVCDRTTVNTCQKEDIIGLMEEPFIRPFKWTVCQLQVNEMYFRHLTQNFEGQKYDILICQVQLKTNGILR